MKFERVKVKDDWCMCKPDGYNIWINCGQAAGQTVMHFHCQVIPNLLALNTVD